MSESSCRCGEGPHPYIPGSSAEAHACLRVIAVRSQGWDTHRIIDQEATEMQERDGIGYFLTTASDLAAEAMRGTGDDGEVTPGKRSDADLALSLIWKLAADCRLHAGADGDLVYGIDACRVDVTAEELGLLNRLTSPWGERLP